MKNVSEKENTFAKYKLLEKYSQFIDVKNDAAFIEQKDKNHLFASALFAEYIDFDLAYFPLKHLGYKVIVATMTDILAMNGTPAQVRINLALSNRFTEDAMDELINGIAFCCSKYNINIVGLDFKPSATGLYIAVSMSGEVAQREEVYQSGAKENELICVTGDLGSAYAGLILLERENKVFQADPSQQPDFIGVDYLLERYLKPEPPIGVFRATPIKPTSMIALKNGLANGLIHLCNASKLGCTVFEEKLPIDILTFDKLKEVGIVATTIALNGGEDYELLFTVKQDDYEKIKELKEVSVIGYMSAESSGRHIITNDNKQFELRAQGY
ncbi:MAG: thiamine-phosphate kinase [Bacteroidetes bacterium]|nr:thiamine-phosphate kinase [Bacteroidota bacterium]MCL1969337.1 thiamine-phosphate kinase [Bacteroidota bacterium]